MNIGITSLYVAKSEKKGFYNEQEIGLAKELKKYGHTMFVFYPTIKETSISEEDVDGVKVIYVPAKKVGVHGYYDWEILKKYKIEILQICADNQLFAPSIIDYCKREGIIYYCYIGTVQSNSNNIIKTKIMRIAFQRNIKRYQSCKCFAKTISVKKQLDSMRISQVEVAPVGLDVSNIEMKQSGISDTRIKLGLPKDRCILLFVGRMDDSKKPLNALKVLKQIENGFLVLIGTGKLDSAIQEKIENDGLRERIKWIKKIPNKEIQEYYYCSDYFMNFNPNEIFGMSILEAMYQGCTVIAIHAPGPNEIIENEINGYLVNNIQEMINIITSNKRIEAENAKQRITSRFTWNTSAKKIDSWIKEEINQNEKTN